MPAAASFRILLGIGDTQPITWDGSVAVTPGKILSIQGWRFAANDSADAAGWKAATRNSPGRRGQVGPILENGVIISAPDDPTAAISVKTAPRMFPTASGWSF
jgi:hypothetical protein